MTETKKPAFTLPGPAVLTSWVVLIVALVWVYWAPMSSLVYRWITESDYVYGFFVPAFSVVLLWDRREMLEGQTLVGSYWGLAFLALGLLMRWASAYYFIMLIDPFSIVPCLIGVVLFIGGWAALRWAWPAIVFLVFMVPLPGFLATMLGHQLQRIGTIVSVFTLQTLGIPAVAQGNVIYLSKTPLEVAAACSGIRMLMLFFAACTGAALLVRRRPIWERILIFISAIPIAVVSNVVRIAVTGLLYETVSPELGEKVFHNLAGWFMMPLAIVLLWAELGLLSAILIEPVGLDSMSTQGSPLGRPATRPGAPAGKSS